jgi:hypothetical protein
MGFKVQLGLTIRRTRRRSTYIYKYTRYIDVHTFTVK